ncbi:MAG TPA: YfhO family protein, partial [Candidatus Bathyarchaeia archaeon]|nr:YfhO family protein [Candidatus Bathyarchaeia archaeon]
FFAIDREASFRELERSLVTGLASLVVYALAIFLVRRSARPSRVMIGALLALAVIDPALHNRSVNPTVPASAFETPYVQGLPSAPLTVYRDETQTPSLKTALGDEVRLHRFYRQSLYPFTGIGDGIRYALNWDFYGTYPRSYLELCDAVRGLAPDKRMRALRAAGCAVSLGLEPAFSKAAASRRPIEGIDLWLETVPGAQTVPFVAYRAVAATGVIERLRLLTADGFDPVKTVVTDRDLRLPADPGSGPDGPGAVTVRSATQGGGRYFVSLSREGVAVFPGNSRPGWRAWVDGQSAEVFEADLFSKGVRVPAGEHEVVLRYRPSSFLWGVAISLISLATLVAGAWISGRRPRRRGLRASS